MHCFIRFDLSIWRRVLTLGIVTGTCYDDIASYRVLYLAQFCLSMKKGYRFFRHERTSYIHLDHFSSITFIWTTSLPLLLGIGSRRLDSAMEVIRSRYSCRMNWGKGIIWWVPWRLSLESSWRGIWKTLSGRGVRMYKDLCIARKDHMQLLSMYSLDFSSSFSSPFLSLIFIMHTIVVSGTNHTR